MQGFIFVATKGNEAAFPLIGGGKCDSGSKDKQTTKPTKKREIYMTLIELSNLGTNVSVTITAVDLRNFLTDIANRLADAKKPKQEGETYLTQDDVSEKLGVDRSTLWRWDKNGYLRKTRVGGKVRYKLSDIEKLMEGR